MQFIASIVLALALAASGAPLPIGGRAGFVPPITIIPTVEPQITIIPTVEPPQITIIPTVEPQITIIPTVEPPQITIIPTVEPQITIILRSSRPRSQSSRRSNPRSRLYLQPRPSPPPSSGTCPSCPRVGSLDVAPLGSSGACSTSDSKEGPLRDPRAREAFAICTGFVVLQ
ncbi:hypothetical protein B0H13DRAFT_810272 [Mycena leptocephala]|nr:hypothetical protein B0H13DRAFT_810272 [Mycena leptocephala]